MLAFWSLWELVVNLVSKLLVQTKKHCWDIIQTLLIQMLLTNIHSHSDWFELDIFQTPLRHHFQTRKGKCLGVIAILFTLRVSNSYMVHNNYYSVIDLQRDFYMDSWLIDWLIDGWIDWLIDWLVSSRLIDWLTRCIGLNRIRAAISGVNKYSMLVVNHTITGFLSS